MIIKVYFSRLAVALTLGSLVGLNTFEFVQAKPFSFQFLAQSSTVKKQALTPQVLANATYQIPDRGFVTLSNGQYQAKDFNVTLEKLIAIDDLNQDGTDDAAVLLTVQTGGSGTFLYLAAVTQSQSDGSLTNSDTSLLGDRVQIKTLMIKKGAIQVKMLKAKPTDPLCCPTDIVIESFQFNNTAGTLTPIILSEKDKQEMLIEDVPSPVLGDGDNVPTSPELGEIQIKL